MSNASLADWIRLDYAGPHWGFQRLESVSLFLPKGRGKPGHPFNSGQPRYNGLAILNVPTVSP